MGKCEKQQVAMAKLAKYRMDGFGLIGFYRLNYSIAVSGTDQILPISFFHFSLVEEIFLEIMTCYKCLSHLIFVS